MTEYNRTPQEETALAQWKKGKKEMVDTLPLLSKAEVLGALSKLTSLDLIAEWREEGDQGVFISTAKYSGLVGWNMAAAFVMGFYQGFVNGVDEAQSQATRDASRHRLYLKGALHPVTSSSFARKSEG